MKIWSSLAILFVIALAGCGEGAKLLQEREDGGVVAYPFIGEQGPMLSSFRTDALALMKENAGALYHRAGRGNERAISHSQPNGGRRGSCAGAPVGHSISV